MWVVIAFIALCAFFIVALAVGSGFFILRGMLQIIQATQTALGKQQDSDNADRARQDEDRKRSDAIKLDLADFKGKTTTALDEMRSTNATKTGQLRSETGNAAILSALDDVTKDVSGSTERTLEASSKIPQATAELLAVEFNSINEKLKILVDTAPSEELKKQIIQLEATVAAIPKALDECLKQNAQMNLAADVSDLRHDKDVKQHTADVEQHVKDVDGLSLVSGEDNRKLIDGDLPVKDAA